MSYEQRQVTGIRNISDRITNLINCKSRWSIQRRLMLCIKTSLYLCQKRYGCSVLAVLYMPNKRRQRPP